MKDRELFFDEINSTGLEARRQNVISEYNDSLWIQDGKYTEQPMVIVSPTRYDGETNLGLILTNEPIVLKYFGTANVNQVQYKIGSAGTYYNMTKTNNVWLANIDWSKYKGLSTNNLYIKALSNNVLVREISQPFKVLSTYPNVKPVISYSDPELYKQNFSGSVLLNMNFSDDNYDVNLVELFVDGVRRNYWKYNKVKSGDVSYLWYTTTETTGGHILRYKITDQFGRKTYSEKLYVNVGTGSVTPTSTPISPTPTVTLTPTVTPTNPNSTPTPSNTLTPTPTVPITCSAVVESTISFRSGQSNYTETIDTSFFMPGVTPTQSSNPLENQPWTASSIKVSGYYPKYRSLIKFPLSSLPTNSRIKSAVLSFSVMTWDGQTQKPTQNFARLSKPFDQQIVNWTNATSTILWSTPGASGVGTDYFTPVKSKLINWGVNTIDVTDFVQFWVSNPATNNGILIWETDAHMANYYSSEYSDITKRPQLTVTYSSCN